MANLRITWLGHGGILYRSPNDAWVWVDRWTGAPTYPDAYREAERVSVVAPTHGHFDHAGDDLADVLELARADEAKPMRFAPVDLVPIAQDAALDAMASQPERTVSVIVAHSARW